VTKRENDEVAEDSESEALMVICNERSFSAGGTPWRVCVTLSNEHQLGRPEAVYDRDWFKSVENVNGLKDQV
jgi:hypothetical protein